MLQERGLAVVLKALAPASKRPLINPKQVGCFQLIELRRLVAAQNVQKPHHTHTLKGFRPAHPNPPKRAKRYRTDRVLPKPDISSATDRRNDALLPDSTPRYIVQFLSVTVVAPIV